ncbi:MAG: exodeoxyribonuclease VII small subunit [Clostridia bacterium]|nr:exodeoxyribonuclease VII small subunit [Clostridia bacterium]MBR5987640.1 exodeoxyribonuclease VII small subunit [Clostridia bacterium]
MTFEEILSELSEISASLENASLPLEEGIAIYGKGLELAKKAIATLKDAKGKITLLTDELGKLAETTFEVEGDD